MSQKARVERLERKTGGKDAEPLVIAWGDGSGMVTVNGERMTEAEALERWPAARVIRVIYESHPAIRGELVE